jgi:hypothetical protein
MGYAAKGQKSRGYRYSAATIRRGRLYEENSQSIRRSRQKAPNELGLNDIRATSGIRSDRAQNTATGRDNPHNILVQTRPAELRGNSSDVNRDRSEAIDHEELHHYRGFRVVGSLLP